ncbi:hypothetical protein HAX54_019305 [Datura stramonium]|uniref:Uncharacterized protein n=1 Tax=Datura stramonium TaxID=4076 RepID=A0ABS8UQI0_DATST|nr:hypothetical protein [Datura stramonium]
MPGGTSYVSVRNFEPCDCAHDTSSRGSCPRMSAASPWTMGAQKQYNSSFSSEGSLVSSANLTKVPNDLLYCLSEACHNTSQLGIG